MYIWVSINRATQYLDVLSGTNPFNMDDDWGYHHDSGNLFLASGTSDFEHCRTIDPAGRVPWMFLAGTV